MTVAGELLPIVSPAGIGKSTGFTWPAGDFTVGCRYRLHRPLVCVGIRYWAKFAGTKTIKVTLWTSVGSAILAQVSAAVVGTGQLEEVIFATPVALPANTDTTSYYATAWETAGAVYCGVGAGGGGYIYSLTKQSSHPGAVLLHNSYAAGDAFPATNNATLSTSFYCVEPILKRP